ncbi:MAG: hypothetical protein AB7P40_07630 [Chloroflexota bacterium]
MTHYSRASSQNEPLSSGRACPTNPSDHVLVDLTEDEARRIGRPGAQTVHVDRSRQPTTGDLVWAELVRLGSTQRLVRRYALDDGWVTLSAPGGGAAAIMRRRAELLVLGVVDDSSRCPAGQA